MTEVDPVRLALKFANEINRHDVDALTALMSDNHRFVDSLGQEIRGRENLKGAWKWYFDHFPDYHIDIQQTFQAGPIVAFIGTASGTYSTDGKLAAQNRWKIPAAWKARVEQDRVVHWQVFADNEPVRSLMEGKSGHSPAGGSVSTL